MYKGGYYKLKNKYRTKGDVVYIKLNRREGPNLEAIIDLDDFDLINSYDGMWSASEDKRWNITYCVIKSVNKEGHWTTIKLHRIIMNAQDKIQVDHLNHNGLDNKKCNLRLVTDGENKQNHIKPKKNKIDKNLPVGVNYEYQKNSWVVRLKRDYDDVYCHHFANKNFAIEAYKYARAYYLPYSFEATEIDKSDAFLKLKDIEFRDELAPSRSNNKSGHRNISWHKRIKKWYAYITINKKRIGIGYFDDIDKAAKAVENARIKYGTSHWSKVAK